MEATDRYRGDVVGHLRSVVGHRGLQMLTVAVLTLMCVGSVFYWQVEGWPFIDAMYFSVATLATVGYGDFTPTTTAGKVFTVFSIAFGLGIVATFGAALARAELRLLARA